MIRRTSHALRTLRHADHGLTSAEYLVLLMLVVASGVAVFNVVGNTLTCKLAAALGSFSDALGVPTASASASSVEQCADAASGLGSSGSTDGSAGGSDGASASASGATHREPADRGGKGKSGKKPPPTPDQWAKNMQAILCPDDKAFLAQLQRDGVTVSLHDEISFADVEYDGKVWHRAPFPAAGATDGRKHVYIARTNDPVEDAATLIHEGRHTQQPASMNQDDVEPDAYLFEEQWRAKHGYPPHDPSFRQPGDAGASVQDMRDYVDKTYPGKDPGSPGSAPEFVFQRNADGTVSVERADGTVYKRKPKRGDSVPGPQVNKPKKGYPVDLAKLQCP